MSDIIEPVEDYGMQISEVVETFHQDGKCVGCGHSMDSWCKKHKGWAYAIGACGKEVVEPPKPEKKICNLSGRTAHNARAVRCSDGREFQSMFLAAKAFGITAQYLRRVMKADGDIGTYKFEYIEGKQ